MFQSEKRELRRPKGTGAGGNSPLSSQVIWGAGVPRTEHRSTKSWPSMTTLSFRTLENEGAVCVRFGPVKANIR